MSVVINGTTGINVSEFNPDVVVELIDSSSTHLQIPTAKAVVDYALRRDYSYSATVATTSGFEHTIGGIPAWANDVVVDLEDVSLTTNDLFLVQLGTAGGIQTTGYEGGATSLGAASLASTNSTIGHPIYVSATLTASGRVRIERFNGNRWYMSHDLTYKATTTGNMFGVSLVTLSGPLTQIRLIRASGAPTFDLGSFRIGWR